MRPNSRLVYWIIGETFLLLLVVCFYLCFHHIALFYLDFEVFADKVDARSDDFPVLRIHPVATLKCVISLVYDNYLGYQK